MKNKRKYPFKIEKKPSKRADRKPGMMYPDRVKTLEHCYERAVIFRSWEGKDHGMDNGLDDPGVLASISDLVQDFFEVETEYELKDFWPYDLFEGCTCGACKQQAYIRQGYRGKRKVGETKLKEAREKVLPKNDLNLVKPACRLYCYIGTHGKVTGHNGWVVKLGMTSQGHEEYLKTKVAGHNAYVIGTRPGSPKKEQDMLKKWEYLRLKKAGFEWFMPTEELLKWAVKYFYTTPTAKKSIEKLWNGTLDKQKDNRSRGFRS